MNATRRDHRSRAAPAPTPPPASAGTSIAAPVRRPLKNAHAARRNSRLEVGCLQWSRLGSAIAAVARKAARPVNRSMLGPSASRRGPVRLVQSQRDAWPIQLTIKPRVRSRALRARARRQGRGRVVPVDRGRRHQGRRHDVPERRRTTTAGVSSASRSSRTSSSRSACRCRQAVLRRGSPTSSTARPTRKNGAIVAADFYYTERARREFQRRDDQGDRRSRSSTAPTRTPAYMAVALAVEDIVFIKGGGEQARPRPPASTSRSCGPRATSGSGSTASRTRCKRVTKIDSFTVKQNIVEYHAGGMQARRSRRRARSSSRTSSFYVPEADAQPFFDHMHEARSATAAKGHGEVRQTAQSTARSVFDNAEAHAVHARVLTARTSSASRPTRSTRLARRSSRSRSRSTPRR